MKRREFLQTSAATSACTLAAGHTPRAVVGEGTQQESVCKITVLRKTLSQDFIRAYRESEIGPCSRFEEGQEFLIDSPWLKPEGFCDWAWADIRTFIHCVQLERFERFVACCTDGFRPVFFLIERTNG